MPLRHVIAAVALVCAAAPASAQERQWSLDAGDQDAYLIFGVPDSDDVGVSLWCPVRQGAINIFLPEIAEKPAGGTMTMTVSAEGQSVDIPGKTEENLDAGLSSIEGQLPVSHPVFRAMARADRFHIKIAGKDEVFPLIEADLAGLLALCRKE
jgi:hypothetical protein